LREWKILNFAVDKVHKTETLCRNRLLAHTRMCIVFESTGRADFDGA